MTLSEQLHQQREAKKLKQQQRTAKNALPQFRKHAASCASRQKLFDFIPPSEWEGGAGAKYHLIVSKLLAEGNITTQDLLDHFVQLHRFTFWNCDYDFSRERKIIERVFEKYITDDSQANAKVFIHYKHRQLLQAMLDEVWNSTKSFDSRLAYGQATADYIIEHNIYCGLSKCVVGRYIDQNEIKSVLNDMRFTLNIQEIAKKAKQGIMTLPDESINELVELRIK